MGQPWFEKPALLYWMTAVGFSRRVWAANSLPRLPVALLSVWFLVFYFLRMRREFGERSAWIASAMLATSAGWIVFSHVAVTEIPLATTFRRLHDAGAAVGSFGRTTGIGARGCSAGICCAGKGSGSAGAGTAIVLDRPEPLEGPVALSCWPPLEWRCPGTCFAIFATAGRSSRSSSFSITLAAL